MWGLIYFLENSSDFHNDFSILYEMIVIIQEGIGTLFKIFGEFAKFLHL